MNHRKTAQQYSAEEFDAVVALIQGDASLRADIEAITGQSLNGKNPRELFDTFRAIGQAAELQISVAKYGRARQMVRQVRAELAALPPADMPMETAAYVADVQRRLDEAKQENAALRAANAALNAGRGATPLSTAGRVVQGAVERPAEQREVAS
ncbi:hypothetical protein [Sphaerisporangium sp. TRM90804]|uniref:hypothetical protein n=1 Tax=Sphaerisporangium sp. TRM90804 TaxID=3031113 RepID=UPI00244CB1F1|nr:hypothetical protein [Sphaerisporangium sp. TRM90804]MDH2424820.1 hypothetical protein [Sphaerisporangium sp. TRM90804]